MATLLYRLGRASFRRAWLVLVAWIIVLGTFLGGGVALGGQLADDFSIPGTEAQEALDQLDALFPETSGASVQAVVEAPEGELITDAAVRDELDDLQSALADVDGVVSTLGPFEEFASNQLSDDERVAIIQVQFDTHSVDVTDEQIAELLATADGALTHNCGLFWHSIRDAHIRSPCLFRAHTRGYEPSKPGVSPWQLLYGKMPTARAIFRK